MGMKRSRRPRDCSLCGKSVGSKEQRHAMRGKFVYYDNYALDIGQPTKRRNVFLCPDCTTATARLWRAIESASEELATGEGD